ncbi:XRE family transcriptional regulator [Saccharopolyspora erythraea NRRL 2338]|uniref:Transcriptional regulator, Cro/CI family n=2 Tax=Saccharopolyspora erythraea TaxID=1836 RepID=A4F638_SACEN|nr:XRE family transcriptional regulator [Saccharopolyspora erythraea D]PFG93311.1 XRE family transcriptional regulator [Saccharopolyspora erythraea NRRL 2338]QRK90155.1 cupin domain-containing protein [Saccharopolyspora erythraea]CAL99512.1 transcriptional regulator, Cro/CI family [Saccharopolyspora erythraea NRRL 2338]
MVGGVSDQPETPNGSAGQALAGLGGRIGRLRTERGLDQATLARRAELEQTHLAGVESGTATPSLPVLAQLAEALDVGLSELFTDARPGPAAVVLRGDEVPSVDDGGMSVQVLTPRAVIPGLYAARYRLSSASSAVRPVRHVGHDWLYVLSGELHVEFESDSTTLRAGDSVSFSSKVPHKLSAVGGQDAEFLAVGATLLTPT